MGSLEKNKYKVIKNFLSKEEIELAKKYILIRHRQNSTKFDKNQNNNGDTMFYQDPFTEALLYSKLKLMENKTKLKLFPTYSFSRVYTYNSELTPHKDRPSCEISVTIMFGSDGTKWPIYMKDTPIELLPGDACIYLGCEIEHSRKHFTGDWHAQAFLHYVNQNGPNTKYKFDGKQPSLHPTLQS